MERDHLRTTFCKSHQWVNSRSLSSTLQAQIVPVNRQRMSSLALGSMLLGLMQMLPDWEDYRALIGLGILV
jgi:hypothetical protein